MDHKNTPLKSSAKDVFSYLFMAILLTWSAVSLGTLLWQSINLTFPDSLYFYYQNIADLTRTSMAGLIITWPLFLGISKMINHDLAATPAKSDLLVRKWLLHLILFVCGLVGVIDLVTLLNNFLSGELTSRFVLKALVVLVIASSVFGYYLWDLKRHPKTKSLAPFISSILASAVIIGAIITGFVIVGTPSKQRALRFDDQRVTDLQGLQWEIINHWQQKSTLPESLSALSNEISDYRPATDPETKVAYEYRVVDSLTFELCATFTHPSPAFEIASATYSYSRDTKSTSNWDHEAGRTCFTRTIDPDVYPPTN